MMILAGTRERLLRTHNGVHAVCAAQVLQQLRCAPPGRFSNLGAEQYNFFSCVLRQVLDNLAFSLGPDQHCFARRTVEGHVVNIPRVVTRVLRDQQCFAFPGASDVGIQRVVTRVQSEQHWFARRTVEGSDVNFLRVVTRVLGV
jgi:hypothetical protein